MTKSTLAFAALAGHVAAQQGYGSGSATTVTYACNPAHQYPAGQVCTTISGTLTLITTTGTAPATSPTTFSCPAPGTNGPDGRYSCNPAHQYPEGQQCIYSDGCYYLVAPGPGISVSATSASAPASYPTSSCPAPGSTDSQGRYSCNPAHQYPENQLCLQVDGCYFLVSQGSGATATPYKTSSASESTTTCPAPGTTNSNGQYSCNPAHQYPQGQVCELSNGCYILTTVSVDTPTYSISATSSGSPIPTGVPTAETCNCYLQLGECQVAPNANQAYCASQFSSCVGYIPYTGDNAATVYFNNLKKYCTSSATTSVDTPVYTPAPSAPKYTTKVETAYTTYCPQPTIFTHESKTYTITKATTVTLPCPGGCTVTKPIPAPYPTSSSSCPAPGTTGPDGCYSCNPAHQYPKGQSCGLVKGCYCLRTPPKSFNTVASGTIAYGTVASGSVSPVYTTKVVTQLTTYCPQPTTFTHESKTYTITKATTVTLPCPGGCIVTSKVVPPPPAYTKSAPPPSSPVKSFNTVASGSVPPVYTTKVVTQLTTYCPQPTIFTHESKTYTVTKATTVTLPCPGGCIVTSKVVPPPPPAYTKPAPPPPSSPVKPPASMPPASMPPASLPPSSHVVPPAPSSYTKSAPPPISPVKPPASMPPASMPPASMPPSSHVVPPAPSSYTKPAPQLPSSPVQPPPSSSAVVPAPPPPSSPVQPQQSPSLVVPPPYVPQSSSVVTQPAPQLPSSPVQPQQSSSAVVPPPPSSPVQPQQSSSAVVPPSYVPQSSSVVTQPAPPPPSSPVQPQQSSSVVVPSPYVPQSSSVVTQPAASATNPVAAPTGLVPYTGAAVHAKTAAPMMVAVAFGALFL